MAIINEIPGLKVEVIANGGPLREYGDEDANNSDTKITKYIEVNPDGTFEILVQFLDEYVATRGVRVEVRLDDVKVSSSLIALSQLKREGGHKFSGVSSKIDNRWNMSNFKFLPFVVEKDSARKLDKVTEDRLNKAGTVTVLLHRVKNLCWPRARRHEGPEKANIAHGISGFKTLPEKRVQELGLSHHGGVGVPQQKRGGKTLTYEWVDGKEDEHAFAAFHSKYRSIETLRALGIVPRTPSPPSFQNVKAKPASASKQPTSRSSQADEHDGLSSEELTAIITVFRGHSNGLAGLTQQALLALLDHHMRADTPVRCIKRERSEDDNIPREGKKRRSEVIELE